MLTNLALYQTLVKLGANEAQAAEAAQQDVSLLATKADMAEFRAEVRTAIADLETRVIKWNVATIIAMTAIFAAIVKLV